jgi:hypothetical protein
MLLLSLVRLYDVSLYTDQFFGKGCEKLYLSSIQSNIVKPCGERVHTQGGVKLDTEGKENWTSLEFFNSTSIDFDLLLHG